MAWIISMKTSLTPVSFCEDLVSHRGTTESGRDAADEVALLGEGLTWKSRRESPSPRRP